MTILLLLFVIPFLFGSLIISVFRTSRCSPIILFHDLTQHFPRSLSEFPLKRFESLLNHLQTKQISFVPFSERTDHHDPRGTIIFDDGFRSNLVAAELLQEHNIAATFFVCTAHLNNEEITDVYQSKPRLNSHEIKRIVDLGHEIGSHTTHHYDLRLLNKTDLTNELIVSKRELESITQKPVISLSIPYGLWNDEVITVAKECGYKSVAVYNFPKEALKRERVYPVTGVYPFESARDIAKKLNGKNRVSDLISRIIPHFAKGSPLAAYRSVYIRLPFPWFMNGKKNSHSQNK